MLPIVPLEVFRLLFQTLVDCARNQSSQSFCCWSSSLSLLISFSAALWSLSFSCCNASFSSFNRSMLLCNTRVPSSILHFSSSADLRNFLSILICHACNFLLPLFFFLQCSVCYRFLSPSLLLYCIRYNRFRPQNVLLWLRLCCIFLILICQCGQ